MASSKRKKHGAGYVVLIAVLILVLLAVVAAVTGYSLVARRVKALQAGAAFTFDYEITSTADSPALYTILQKTGSTKGTVNGLEIEYQYLPTAHWLISGNLAKDDAEARAKLQAVLDNGKAA